jgi:hypothetical protein
LSKNSGAFFALTALSILLQILVYAKEIALAEGGGVARLNVHCGE